jgi:hypothetical protein
MHAEVFDDRVRQELVRQLGHAGQGGVVHGLTELNLEPFALADAHDLAEPEAMARAGDRFSLRVVDPGLEHHLDDDCGHERQRTPAPGTCLVTSAGRGQSCGKVTA